MSDEHAEHCVCGAMRWVTRESATPWSMRPIKPRAAVEKAVTILAPKTPGAAPTLVWRGNSVAEAREVAEREYGHRRDLTWQDVRIMVGDHRVEYAGPL